MRQARSFDSDQTLMPISSFDGESATSAICSTTSAMNLRGPARETQQYGHHQMTPMPPSFQRWRIRRTHAGVSPTRDSISLLQTPPAESKIIRAWRRLTPLASCRFIRFNARRSYRVGLRALTQSIFKRQIRVENLLP